LRAPAAMHRRRFLVQLLAFAGLGVVVALAGCAHSTTPRFPSPDSLTPLVVERLELAREVAFAKHHSGAPVHDPAREAELLAGIVAQAVERGLDAAEAERVFSAQLAASRRAQEELLEAWRAGQPPPDRPPPELRRELRPRLDALTPRLLDALSAPRSPALPADLARALDSAGFSPAVISLATGPWR
jgi:chorismate mutase